MHLVFPGSVDEATHRRLCRRKIYDHWSRDASKTIPALLQVSDRADEEAAPIYYGENHFTFDGLETYNITAGVDAKYIRLIRKMTLDWNPGVRYSTYRVWMIQDFKGLQELNIKVDERRMVHYALSRRDKRQDYPLKAKGAYTAQEQLAIFRTPGVTDLLHLQRIPTVNFLRRMDSESGPIPGGILLTRILPKLIAPIVVPEEVKKTVVGKRKKPNKKTKREKIQYAGHVCTLQRNS